MTANTVTNLVQGFAAEFTAEFRNPDQTSTIPSGANLTISYPAGLATVTASQSMTQYQPYRFVTTWYSAVSDLGLVSWSISASSISSGPQAVGTIRVIRP